MEKVPLPAVCAVLANGSMVVTPSVISFDRVRVTAALGAAVPGCVWTVPSRPAQPLANFRPTRSARLRTTSTIERMDVTLILTVHVRTCPKGRLGRRATARDYLEKDWTRMSVGETDVLIYCDHVAWHGAHDNQAQTA